MSVLLDTNVALLAGLGSPRLGAIADVLADEEVILSPVVAWEISIKVSIGRLDLGSDPATYVEELRVATDARTLPITTAHATAVADLPPHHRDPFDRLLVAIARTEQLTLATTDRVLTAYDVELALP